MKYGQEYVSEIGREVHVNLTLPIYDQYSFFERFGERVETFFSPRMWHHAGRPTTGHSTETIGKNS